MDAQIMLVGEAPGRLGAERTGIPFYGDTSGDRLERLLAAAGWQRGDVFLTNAVLCNPQDHAGRNRAPSTSEQRQCSAWLERQILTINPTLVVALGGTALRSLALIEPHLLAVSDSAGSPVPWFGRQLAARYHPGARAGIHRPFAKQMDDFRNLGDWFRDQCRK